MERYIGMVENMKKEIEEWKKREKKVVLEREESKKRAKKLEKKLDGKGEEGKGTKIENARKEIKIEEKSWKGEYRK